MNAAKTKGRFAIDLLLSLEDKAISKVFYS